MKIVEIHGNQQGTFHGGLFCELADAAIGTAHSTVIGKNIHLYRYLHFFYQTNISIYFFFLTT